MIDIKKYRKILIITDFSSKINSENLFNSFKSYLDNDFICIKNRKIDVNEILTDDKTLCLIDSLDYIKFMTRVNYQQDLILYFNNNKIFKYKDRYFLNVDNIYNEIRLYKLNKILK